MSNSTWACFECRQAVRRDTQFRGKLSCAKCGEPMRLLGYKIPLPNKRDAKAWMTLRDELNHEKAARQDWQRKQHVRRKHEIEHEISRLKAMPANRGRQSLIRSLKKELMQIARA